MESKDIPLCVDLDGTLIRSDILLESLLVLIKKRPWIAFMIPFWLLRGRVFFKNEITKRVDLNVQTLPYQAELVDFLKKEHAIGRLIVLATASHRRFADEVANHLGIFTKVHATDDDINLLGRAKKDLLVKHYGQKGFDYAGNSRADLYVWSVARKAILVNPGRGVLRDAAVQCPVSHTFEDRHPTLSTYAKELRIHQWLKNILVFIPMLGAHEISSFNLWVDGILGFISFSLCASSVYLLNDLLDLPADRLHPRKRNRPFASGELSMVTGMLLTPLLLLAGFAVAILWLPTAFLIVLLGYYFLTLS